MAPSSPGTRGLTGSPSRASAALRQCYGGRPAATLLCAMVLLTTTESAADDTYAVREGDTLASIAVRFQTTVRAIRAANGLLSNHLQPGQDLAIPEEGVVFVESGDTLSSLARSHDVSVVALRRANRLGPNETLRVGQRLVLPGAEATAARGTSARRWGRPRRPGVLRIRQLHGGAERRITIVDRRGRVRPEAISRLARLMRARKGRAGVRRPHPRLLRLLARVSDHFGGREIMLISGFRAPGGYTSARSKHTQGRAVDFRVQGVPNTAVRDYCRRFAKVGVGYYPRSTFVHLDVRDRSAYWVDWSRPGQAPRYGSADGPDAASEDADLITEPGSDALESHGDGDGDGEPPETAPSSPPVDSDAEADDGRGARTALVDTRNQ